MRTLQILVFILLTLFLAPCSGCYYFFRDGPPRYPVDLSHIPNAVPKREPRSHYGNPHSYTIQGHTYHVLSTARGYDRYGTASWYGRKFNGKLTATREVYNMFNMTAASTELPLPTYVRVTNLRNGRTVIVRVNDRGPFHAHRILDLSYAAAQKLGFARRGTAPVRVTAIFPR